MTGLLKIMTTLAVVVVLTPNVIAIRCWTCLSDADPNCGEPFDNSTLAIRDCEYTWGQPHLRASTLTMCRKVKQKVNGRWSYYRGCEFRSDIPLQGGIGEGFCLTREGSYEIEYSTCSDRDGCNSSYMITPTPFMMILLIGLSCFLKFIS